MRIRRSGQRGKEGNAASIRPELGLARKLQDRRIRLNECGRRIILRPVALIRKADAVSTPILPGLKRERREVTMPVNVNDKIRKLCPAQWKKVEARAAA
jgi:hypothetical protein